MRDGEVEGSGTSSKVIAFRVAMSIFTNVGEGTCQCVVVKNTVDQQWLHNGDVIIVIYGHQSVTKYDIHL